MYCYTSSDFAENNVHVLGRVFGG